MSREVQIPPPSEGAFACVLSLEIVPRIFTRSQNGFSIREKVQNHGKNRHGPGKPSIEATTIAPSTVRPGLPIPADLQKGGRRPGRIWASAWQLSWSSFLKAGFQSTGNRQNEPRAWAGPCDGFMDDF